MRIIGAKRYRHSYVIATGEYGHSASYNDLSLDRTHTRFIGNSLKAPLDSLSTAKDACEADLRILLGRLQ